MHADEEYEIRNTTITTTQSKKKKYNAHAYVKQISLSLFVSSAPYTGISSWRVSKNLLTQ